MLKTLKEIGVERVELCSPFGYKEFAPLADPKLVKKVVKDHGMKCESAHFSMRELRENQQKSIDWAKEVRDDPDGRRDARRRQHSDDGRGEEGS